MVHPTTPPRGQPVVREAPGAPERPVRIPAPRDPAFIARQIIFTEPAGAANAVAARVEDVAALVRQIR